MHRGTGLPGPPQVGKENAVIIGAHSIIYSTNAEADRALLSDRGLEGGEHLGLDMMFPTWIIALL